MTIKQMQPTERTQYLTQQLIKLYAYFGNKVELDETFTRQVETLQEEVDYYHSLTQDQFENALKIGRRESTDTFKPSIRTIVQWITTYMIRYNKSEQKIASSGVEFSREYPIEQRKAWIVSSYRQYHENERDMAKFFDFGQPTYKAIYKHCGFSLTHEQYEWCIEMGKRLNVSQMFNPFLAKDAEGMEGNATASAYACKLFFDQFKTEEDLRNAIKYYDNVSKDHFVAAYEKTPQLVAYHRKKWENLVR
jgi:hypothetical protein